MSAQSNRNLKCTFSRYRENRYVSVYGYWKKSWKTWLKNSKVKNSQLNDTEWNDVNDIDFISSCFPHFRWLCVGRRLCYYQKLWAKGSGLEWQRLFWNSTIEMWSINSLNSRWMRTISSRCAGERHAKVLLSVSRWQTYVRFPWESVGVFGQSVYTSLTRYEDEVIIKIMLEQFICSSTIGHNYGWHLMHNIFNY